MKKQFILIVMLVLFMAGNVFGAGNNAYGQLGFKGKSEIHTPTRIPIGEVQSLCVRESLTVATLNNGVIVVWGNFSGPGSRPIFDPVQLNDIEKPIHMANNGKKCFIIDEDYDFFIVSDMLGKYDKKKVYENFHEFKETDED